MSISRVILIVIVLVGWAQAQTWQVNQPGASFTLDGEQGGPAGPLVKTRCIGDISPFSLQSVNVGNPWELVISLSRGVALGDGGIAIPGGQIANIDLTQPLIFLSGLQWAPFPGLLPGIMVATAPIPTLTAQMVVVDPAQAAGVSLSGAAQLHVLSGGCGMARGPQGDDDVVRLALDDFPQLPGSVSLFGTSYTEIHVSANGRVMFGGADGDWTPTVAEALAGQPFVGAWADFDPGADGVVAVYTPRAGALRVEYRHVPYRGQPGTASSFALTFAASSGEIVLSGLEGLDVDPGGSPMLLGISAGARARPTPGRRCSRPAAPTRDRRDSG